MATARHLEVDVGARLEMRREDGQSMPVMVVAADVAAAVGGVARLEHAAARAIRAREVALDDGWWLRADDGGVVRRANAVFAGAPGVDPLARKLERVEAWYEERDRPVRLQLSPASAPVDLLAALRQRGYRLETPVLVMARDLSPVAGSAWDDAVRLAAHADADWAAAYAAALPVHEAPARLRLALAAPAPRAYAGLGDEACGAAVLDGRLVGLFDVATDPGARRRGHARRVTAALIAWGAASGARCAYLQVAEHNLPARALYEGCGFRSVYRYVYAVRPGRDAAPTQ